MAKLRGKWALGIQHRNFTWFPQLEGIRVGTVEVTMSALHELKFAASAAAIGAIFLRTSAATAAYAAHDHGAHDHSAHGAQAATTTD